MSTFGETIRQLRDDAGLTQAELATKVGIAQSYLSRLERGTEDRPAAETVFSLASALGVSCETFAHFFKFNPTPEGE